MSSAKQTEFWQGFVASYAGGELGRPPKALGVIPVRMDVSCPEGRLAECPGSARLWLPRAFIKLDEGKIRARGPSRRVWRINRRSPGLLQTIDMIKQINPKADAPEQEMRLLALAALHNLIIRGIATSPEAHEIALSIGTALGLQLSPLGWAARTVVTLPGQDKTPGEKDRQVSLEELGLLAGRDASRVMHGFVPARILYQASHERNHLDLDDLLGGLQTLVEPLPTTVPLAWRTMTPGAMYDLAWKKPIQDIAAEFGVSESRVRAYSKKNVVEMPSSGFWRMSEEKRHAVRVSLGMTTVR